MASDTDRLLRRRDVEALLSLSRSAIYARLKAGTFPRPINIGSGSVRWLESEIVEWMQQRKRA